MVTILIDALAKSMFEVFHYSHQHFSDFEGVVMNSLGKACNEIKNKYDECFQVWFKEQFLKGQASDEPCEPLYKLYQQCLQACRQLKEEYDSCFNIWFSQKFLKGDTNDSMCSELLKVYKHCVEKTMKENHIEFKDTNIAHLETENEKKVPPSSPPPSGKT